MRKPLLVILGLLLCVSLSLMGCSQRPPSPASNSAGSGSGSGGSSSGSGSGSSSSGGSGSSSASGGGGPKITLSVYSTVSDQSIQNVMKQIAADFEKQNPNIDVQFQFPGSQYEDLLKVKMAANDMPDVFDTHGWAKIRYGKFLADLRNEPWANNLTDTIKPVVTDSSGKVYCLVLSEAKDGLSYNADILKKYHIDPPQTLDQLMAAAKKIKTASNGSITPFFMSGVDNGSIGGPLDLLASPYFISNHNPDAKTLLNGTFDWSKWTPLAQWLLDMKKNGYINKDVNTAKNTDLPQRFAQGKVAFVFGAPTFADEVHKINRNVKIGIMPVPYVHAGDTPDFSGGERYTMGAWKDGKHLAEAKKFIDFFAQKENMTKFNNATKLPPGLKNIPTQTEFTSYYEKFASTPVFPYFDRVYLPNGMWDVMCKTGASLVAGTVTPQQFSDTMKQQYLRLRSTQ